MASYADTIFENETRKQLAAKLERLVDAVADGAPQDYAAYREMVGEIRGCRDGLAACDEARRLIAGEPAHAPTFDRSRIGVGNKMGIIG